MKFILHDAEEIVRNFRCRRVINADGGRYREASRHRRPDRLRHLRPRPHPESQSH